MAEEMAALEAWSASRIRSAALPMIAGSTRIPLLAASLLT
jgi:hypothetical protein